MTALPKITWKSAAAWRMRRHRLMNHGTPAELVSVVSTVCGLHAQVMSSARMALWNRVDGLEPEALETALWESRSLVKLWATRGTLHILPARELSFWIGALRTSPKFHNRGHPEIDALADAVEKVLEARVLTREELAEAVADSTGSEHFADWIRGSWGTYLKAASFRGLICFAPSDGSKVRFTSPRTWLHDDLDRLDPAESLRHVTRRFLAAYAPATPEDLARWWLGPPRPRAGRELIAALGDEVTGVNVDGTNAWVLAADVAEIAAAEPQGSVRLLGAFDPWVLGTARHLPLLDPVHAKEVFRPQGWVSPVILVDGRIVGVWRLDERTGDRPVVELTPFGKLPAKVRSEAEAQADRLATFLDRPGGKPALAWSAG